MTKTPVGAEKSRDYLHKKKLYELLESLVDRLDMMKSATYRFYRGSEWLECTSDNMNCSYKIYHEADFFSLNVLQWDEAEEKFVEIERITYRLVSSRTTLIESYEAIIWSSPGT